jgi:hypothetical protein
MGCGGGLEVVSRDIWGLRLGISWESEEGRRMVRKGCLAVWSQCGGDVRCDERDFMVNVSCISLYVFLPADEANNRWGQPFLYNTYLYHLHRLDHRHNFSPYFYPIYLSLYSTPPHGIQTILRHPLTSFIPQAGICLISGFILTQKANIELAMFVQTLGFVLFNKVCTSQVRSSSFHLVLLLVRAT